MKRVGIVLLLSSFLALTACKNNDLQEANNEKKAVKAYNPLADQQAALKKATELQDQLLKLDAERRKLMD